MTTPEADRLTTERSDPAYAALDTWPLRRTLAAVVASNLRAVEAVANAEDDLARAADGIASRLQQGGRLLYAGAGTSGRIALQDAAELPPTFGFQRAEVFLAGGARAGGTATEGAEDDIAAAQETIDAAAVGPDDALVGIAASGTTPYAIAAVARARQRGAFTVGIANNPGTKLLSAAEVGVLLDTGAEVLAGSTRLAAGTAQKVALNALSTAALVRLGGAYGNLMVGMRPANAKLRARAIDIVATAAGLDAAASGAVLDAAGGSVRAAILMARAGLDLEHAKALLAEHGDRVRDALAAVQEEL